MLSAANAELRDCWQLERRLLGGLNEGAFVLSRPDGSRAVLKWRTSEPERLLGARERLDAARARAWPAPAWLAVGRAPGGACVVQEFIDGRTPPRLDDAVAEQMIEILGVQASLLPGADGVRGAWGCGAGLDVRACAMCAGSAGLTMANAFVRHGRTGQAAGAVPGMVRTLKQVLALAAA